MIIFNSLDNINIPEDTVLTLGKFDGAHAGHLKVLEKVKEIKANKGYKIAVFSINGLNRENITTVLEKRHKMKSMGVDYLIEIPFSQSFSNIEARAFVKDYLVNRCRMKSIVVGIDARFGHNRDGDAELLIDMSESLGFDVFVIDKLSNEEGIEISSTLIRKLLEKGDLKTVNRYLNDYYTVQGIIEHGNEIGAGEFGYATANIFPAEDKLLPKAGVYATYTRIGREYYRSLTNIGSNPTITNDKYNHVRRIETYIIDFDKDIYGQELKIDFVDFIRDEVKFDSLDELKNQIPKDLEKAISIFEESNKFTDEAYSKA